jgi:hypothetical protein
VPVVLLNTAALAAVTTTLIAQVPPAASVPFASETAAEPDTAVTLPPHVFDKPFGVATTSPTGNVSVKATPVSTVDAFGF